MLVYFKTYYRPIIVVVNEHNRLAHIFLNLLLFENIYLSEGSEMENM